MYIEHLDGRYAGQVRDIEPGAAMDLIRVGRAKKAYTDPTPETPGIVARMGGPADKTCETLDCVGQGGSKISFPVIKTKKGK